MTAASQGDDQPLRDGDVVDLTERRRLKRIEEKMPDVVEMALEATRRICEHPTELGDVPFVSPTTWSRARNHPEYNHLLKVCALLDERWTEGADHDALLRFSLLPFFHVQTLRALDGEEIDVPEALDGVVEDMTATLRELHDAVQDGELTHEEKRRLVSRFQQGETDLRRARQALGQTPDCTSLWPSRSNGPRT